MSAVERIRQALAAAAGELVEVDRADLLDVVNQLDDATGTPWPAGRPPYGFRAERGQLYREPAEQAQLALIREFRTQRLSWPEIVAELDARQLRTRGGRPWTPATLRRITA